MTADRTWDLTTDDLADQLAQLGDDEPHELLDQQPEPTEETP